MIPAVVLAAGLSTRMGGRSKALLDLGSSDTFLTRIIDSFRQAGIDDVVVVVGHEAGVVEASLRERHRSARVIHNPDYESGQFSSVLAGLAAIDRPGVRAFLMTPVDVPLVAPATIRAVVDRYNATGAPIVRPVRGAQHGHPVLIDRSLFAALRGADPRTGAKPIVRAHVSPAGDVEIADEGAFLDVDTPEEYLRIRNGLRPRAT